MSEYGMKEAIDEHMPFIDKILRDRNIPIFDRFIRAAYLFFDIAIIDSNYENKKDILRSKAFIEGIIPLVNNWYWNKYGELAKGPNSKIYSGIITPHGHPVLIKIPSTIINVAVPNETVWLTFPDCLTDNESIEDMAQIKINLDSISLEETDRLYAEFNEIVSITRKINLNLGSAGGTYKETADMASGIWGHIEKAITDILSLQESQASIGCWELHLAIEKTLKVYLKQICGSWKYGHDLKKLGNDINKYDKSLDFSLLQLIPSDKDAIKMRYSELIKNISEVVDYYNDSLRLIEDVTSKYKRRHSMNNSSFLLNVAPWAK